MMLLTCFGGREMMKMECLMQEWKEWVEGACVTCLAGWKTGDFTLTPVIMLGAKVHIYLSIVRVQNIAHLF